MTVFVNYTTIDKATGSSSTMRARAADEVAAQNIVRDMVALHKRGEGVYGEVDYRITIVNGGKTVCTEMSIA